MGLIYILTSALFISCSNNDDEPELEPEETDMISWSDVEGFYATKPEKQDLGTSWSTYYSAMPSKSNSTYSQIAAQLTIPTLLMV